MQHIFKILDNASPLLVVAAFVILLIVLELIDKRKRKKQDHLEDYYKNL